MSQLATLGKTEILEAAKDDALRGDA